MLASIAIVLGGLYLAKGVLVPLTLAVLLSFLLSPVCDWLERRGLGRIPAVCATVFVGFVVLGGATWAVVVQVTELYPRVPVYQKNIQAKLRSVNDKLRVALDRINQATEEVDLVLPPGDAPGAPEFPSTQPIAVRLVPAPMSPLRVLSGTFGAMIDVLGSASVVFLLVAFFLVRREDLRDRFVHLIGRANLTVTTQALEDAATRVSHYLATQSLLNFSFGLTIGTGLYFIGVPNAVLWGMAATTLRYIPYLGPILAATMPIGMSMAISTNWVAPILTAGLFVVVELTFNNVLEPWLYGKNTGVSAVAVLVAAVFWTWLWGSVGLLLATPLTVCLLVVGKHVPQLSFLNILLGSERVFDLKTRVYQRLLAGDLEEADDLIKETLTTSSLAEVYDTVLIPALALAESDRRRGNIDAIRQNYIFQSLKETVADLGERQSELSANQTSGNAAPTPDATGLTISPPLAKPCILLMPARDDADEIAAMMLAHLMETSGFRVETISETTLAGELVGLIAERRADVVCISAMPPGVARQTRYLCKRMQGKLPDDRLIVGLWNSREELGKARIRIGCAEAVRVVSTLVQAHLQIQAMVQSLPVQPQQSDQSEVARLVPGGVKS
jgi:predicted PurR-regulated permease PerM